MQSVFTKRIAYSYRSAALIIACTLLAGGIIIQLAFQREVDARNIASILSLQELRSQRLLRNTLLVTGGASNPVTAAITKDPHGDLQSDILSLEQRHALLESGSTPVEVIAAMHKLDAVFVKLDSTTHLFLQETSNKPVSTLPKATQTQVGQQLSVIFVVEQTYLQGVYAIYQASSTQADLYITQLRITEVIVSLLGLGILGTEYFVIVGPAIRAYQEYLKEKEKADEELARQTMPGPV